ncbi:MAG: N-acetyltransferase family protein [Burkholderiaceae bacterium]
MTASDYSCVEVAASGDPIVVRVISGVDSYAIQDGIRRLSEQSYFHRFLASKRPFSTAELIQLANPDYVDHVALIATESSKAGTRTLGIGRFYLVQHAPIVVAELAVVVYDDCHRRGIATALYKHLAQIAQTLGVEEFCAIVHWSNQPMRSFLLKQGFLRVNEASQGNLQFACRLSQSTPSPGF